MKIWCVDYDKYTDAKLRDVASMIGVPLTLGQRLAPYFPDRPVLEIRSGNSPGDYVKAGPVHVVSSKLKNLLERFSVNAEFIELFVDCRTKIESGAHYFLFNLLETVDCLDRHQSVFVDEKGFATDIKKVVIDSSAPEDSHMFRVARTIPSVFVVSESLAEGVREKQCTGVNLVVPDHWKNPQYG